jgi:hypothetical protein
MPPIAERSILADAVNLLENEIERFTAGQSLLSALLPMMVSDKTPSSANRFAQLDTVNPAAFAESLWSRAPHDASISHNAPDIETGETGETAAAAEAEAAETEAETETSDAGTDILTEFAAAADSSTPPSTDESDILDYWRGIVDDRKASADISLHSELPVSSFFEMKESVSSTAQPFRLPLHEFHRNDEDFSEPVHVIGQSFRRAERVSGIDVRDNVTEAVMRSVSTDNPKHTMLGLGMPYVKPVNAILDDDDE